MEGKGVTLHDCPTGGQDRSITHDESWVCGNGLMKIYAATSNPGLCFLSCFRQINGKEPQLAGLQ